MVKYPTANEWKRWVKLRCPGDQGDIKGLRFQNDPCVPEPWFASGNDAVVFQVSKGTTRYALRLFLRRPDADVLRRYDDLLRRCADGRPPGILSFERKSGRAAIGTESIDHEYLLMQWSTGKRLGEFLRDAAARRDGANQLETFQKHLADVLRNLHGRGVAHGDLHFGNVMVTEDQRVDLVDYDSIWVAGRLADGDKSGSGKSQRGKGFEGFVHPGRRLDGWRTREGLFVDYFPARVLELIVRGILECRRFAEWFRSEAERDTVFQASDFSDPRRSMLLQWLRTGSEGLAGLVKDLEESLRLDPDAAPPEWHLKASSSLAQPSRTKHISSNSGANGAGVGVAARSGGVATEGPRYRDGVVVRIVGRGELGGTLTPQPPPGGRGEQGRLEAASVPTPGPPRRIEVEAGRVVVLDAERSVLERRTVREFSFEKALGNASSHGELNRVDIVDTAIEAQVEGWPALECVRLQKCSLTHEGIDLTRATSMTHLEVSGCRAVGGPVRIELPAEAAQLKTLYLSGRIEISLGKHSFPRLVSANLALPELEVLNIQHWSSLEKLILEGCGRLKKIIGLSERRPTLKKISLPRGFVETGRQLGPEPGRAPRGFLERLDWSAKRVQMSGSRAFAEVRCAELNRGCPPTSTQAWRFPSEAELRVWRESADGPYPTWIWTRNRDAKGRWLVFSPTNGEVSSFEAEWTAGFLFVRTY